MELNKTRCRSCGHLNRWHSYKWANTPARQEHNRVNNTTCPKCRSTEVENVEDNETRGPYRMLASILTGKEDS